MSEAAERRENVCDRLANELIRRVYTGHYAAGTRLPPERALALELGTDRTSLRIALAQLKRLNLLSIVQGSGAVVNDYRQHAGIEFFLHAFSLEDSPAEPALLTQMLEYFHLTMPGVYGLVMRNASDDQFAAIEATYRRQCEIAGDPAAAAVLSVDAVDLAAAASGNLLFPCIFRSTRPLRLRLMSRLFSSVDVKERAEAHLRWIQLLRSRTLSPDEVEARYRATLRASFVKAHEFLASFGPAAIDAPGVLVGRGMHELPSLPEVGRPEPVRTTTDRLAFELLRRIYLGVYAAGQRLTPERELAAELGTDRTSLRVALGQLKRMNLISAVQGSGMIVKDFRREAGIDFFEHVFEIEDTPLEGEMLAHVVAYLNATVPSLIGEGARRATPLSMQRLEALYRHALTVADQPDAVAECLTLSEDMFAAATRNVIIELVYRSTRSVRRRLARHVARHVDMRRRLTAYLELLTAVKTGMASVDDVEGLFRAYQRRLDGEAHAALAAASLAPARLPAS